MAEKSRQQHLAGGLNSGGLKTELPTPATDAQGLENGEGAITLDRLAAQAQTPPMVEVASAQASQI